MTGKLLTIVIPVRTEAESISETVRRLTRSIVTPHIILIVDDHVSPTDKTPGAVKHLIKRYKHVQWLAKLPHDADGFGPTLCHAATHVRTPFTVFVMGDGCDDPSDIDKMAAKIQKTDADVIVGCRYMHGGGKIGGPLLQHMCSSILNRCLSATGFPTRDATNAFKLYKTPFLRSILPAHPLTGVEFSLQLSIEGHRKHGKYLDVPTTWRGRTKGASKIRLFVNGFRYLRLIISAIRTLVPPSV